MRHIVIGASGPASVRGRRNIGETLDLAHRLLRSAFSWSREFADEVRKVIAARNEPAETRYVTRR